jgi:hypothetical protein
MAQKLNSQNIIVCQAERSRSLFKFRRGFYLLLSILSFNISYSQDEGIKPPKSPDYKSDSSYNNFGNLRYLVAKAQINKLKTEGALLVRLKTNANAISRLKAAGNMDLATQVERETALANKIVVASYLKEFTFCPVYFFYSSRSDSVKHKKLSGILVDTNMIENPAVICNADFYLIADGGEVYNSSLGIVSEQEAPKAIESGAPSRDAPIIIKNRYFIQLHKPFPYFQIKKTTDPPLVISKQWVSVDLIKLHQQIKQMMRNSNEAKQLINLKGIVRSLNNNFNEFYQKNKGYVIPPEFSQYVY